MTHRYSEDLEFALTHSPEPSLAMSRINTFLLKKKKSVSMMENMSRFSLYVELLLL
jgi:hypothetical protein